MKRRAKVGGKPVRCGDVEISAERIVKKRNGDIWVWFYAEHLDNRQGTTDTNNTGNENNQ